MKGQNNMIILNKKQFERYLKTFENTDNLYAEMRKLFNNDIFYIDYNEGWQERNEFEYKLYNKSNTYYDELTYFGFLQIITDNDYRSQKAMYSEIAKDWQLDLTNHNYSYGELVFWHDYFLYAAKRYGLTKEFRENGII